MASVPVNIPAGIPRSSQTIYDNALRIVISYFGWLALYLASVWLSKLLIPGVRTLKPKEQMFWGLSMVRGIMGSTTLLAAYLVFVDKRLATNVALATTDESWAFLSVGVGFFMFEELTLIYFDIRYRTFSKELHIHHILSFNGFFFAILFNTCHYISIAAFILEASTPFSCICWSLLKLKRENTFIWKANQWLLIYIFHARTFYELWLYYIYFGNWTLVQQYTHLVYTVNFLVGVGSVLFWLTPYWTYKKTKQFFFPVDWNAEAKGKKKNEIDKTS